jgi:acyl-CoA thioester hydrolase
VETARIEYLMRVGAWERYERERIGPIVASLSCDFRKPLTYPDSMLIGARINEIGNSSFKMIHTVVSVGEAIVAAELQSTLVLLDYNTGKPVRVPDDMRDAINQLERVKAAAGRGA